MLVEPSPWRVVVVVAVVVVAAAAYYAYAYKLAAVIHMAVA